MCKQERIESYDDEGEAEDPQRDRSGKQAQAEGVEGGQGSMTIQRVMKMVPKSKQSAIREVYIDSDGIWIALEKGWNADGMDYPARLIHCGEDEFDGTPDVIADLKYQISNIRKLTDKELTELKEKYPQYEW